MGLFAVRFPVLVGCLLLNERGLVDLQTEQLGS
jgi:hypothetical protein